LNFLIIWSKIVFSSIFCSKEETTSSGTGHGGSNHGAEHSLLVLNANSSLISILSIENDGLADGVVVVVAAVGGLVPGGVGRRVRDVLAGGSEEAALVVTLSLGPSPVAKLVRSEGELYADCWRKRLWEEDLRCPGLVELTGGSVGQLRGTERALVLGSLL